MDYIVQDLHNPSPHGALRPATMGDVLDVMARSQRALLAIGLPETTVVAVNDSAEELFGETAETLVGRRATSLYRGADEVHASIALSALAAGALDSYSARCRLDTPNEDLAWVSVRRFELQDVAVAIKMSVPIDHPLPLDGVEQEFTAAATGVAWASRPVHDGFGTESVQQQLNAERHRHPRRTDLSSTPGRRRAPAR